MLTFIMIITGGILLDQLTKFVAASSLSGMTTYPIIPNVLHFTYVENTGAAFNIFTDMRMFLIIITLIFIGILGYLFYILPKTKPFNLVNLGLSFMLSGAIGNLIDRIRLAYVVDFIDFRLINFAVFNIADSLVVIGACILLYAYLKNQFYLPAPPRNKAQKESEESSKKEEFYKEPIRKDVLKDLVLNENNKDIRPVVETEIIRLKSEPVSVYTPSQNTYRDYRRQRKETQEESLNNEEVVIINENRYTKFSDQYLESIQKQRENDTGRVNKLNSYHESIDRFKSQIEKERSSKNKRQETVWEPERSPHREKVKTYESNWHPEISSGVKSKPASRYYDQIDKYEESVKKLKEKDKIKDIEFNWDEKELDTEPASDKPNRYYESADSYLKSIEKIKNKNYTEKTEGSG